jgi:SAM-dependent methyltransferase
MEPYAEWKGWEASTFGRFTDCEARYYTWHVKRALEGRAPQRVLEIGFGNGAFLGFGRDRGWAMTGVELSPELRQRAEHAGFQTAADIDALAEGPGFDLVVLFDVLEHVEPDQLIAFVAKLRKCLMPDGAIVLRVPNGDSPFGRRHQHGDLTHRVAIGEFMLQQIAAACDMRVAAIGESSWRAQQHEPPNLRARWRSRLRKILNRLFGFAYFGGTVDLSPNLAAVLKPLRRAP